MLFHLPVKAQVKGLRFRSVFFLQYPDPLCHDDLRDRITRVLDVPQLSRPEGTGLNAGGLKPLGDPVIAEVALFRCVIYRVEEPDAIRTAHDTVSATDTPGPVDHDNTVRRLIGCADRADLNAGRIFALVAELGHKEGLFYIFLPDVLEFSHPQGLSCL